MSGRDKLPSGGHGGSAVVRGKNGIALGGRGGRGGNIPGTSGGTGGSATVNGDGVAIGGDGGDAGRSGRPSIGAPSVIERTLVSDHASLFLQTLVDEYGILTPGRGGDGGFATIMSDGREYSLNVLLKLLRIWCNEIIDTVDDLALETPQNWWDAANVRFPEECGRALAHVRSCEDHSDLPPLSPYST